MGQHYGAACASEAGPELTTALIVVDGGNTAVTQLHSEFNLADGNRLEAKLQPVAASDRSRAHRR